MPSAVDQKKILSTLTASDVQKVKLAFTDIDGVLRGKMMSKEKFIAIAEKGFGFCDVVFGWDSSDLAYTNGSLTGWHTGYPDALATVDLGTSRNIPWENELPFFLCDFSEDEKMMVACPRTLLKQITKQAGEEGYLSLSAHEFEWFNFIDNSNELYKNKFTNLQPISQAMFGYSILRASQNSTYFNALFDQLTAMGIPIEGIHTETGPGVFEAAIAYSETIEAADRAVLFKSGVKEIAGKHGILASFMAKWNEQLPGCSGHIHQSLWSAEEEKNLFYDDASADKMSSIMQHFLAGQLYCLPQILPMYAPTVNSYKRLVEGAWAPTTATWGMDNRTTAFRVVGNSSSSMRIESRIVGSDANPYLASAASLASGLYGIRNRLPLQTATIGSGYEDQQNGKLPGNLRAATLLMKQSLIAKELFGESFVDHFVATREWEWNQYNKAVTDWELRRYFEII